MDDTTHSGPWAVCPTLNEIESDKRPLVFKTLDEACTFLNSEVALPPAEEEAERLGIPVEELILTRQRLDKARTEAERKLEVGEIALSEFPIQFQRYYNRNAGWAKPMPVKSVREGPRVRRLFREFLPVTQLGTPSRPTLEHKIQQILEGTLPEFSCYLEDSWWFDQIEQDLGSRSSHRFEGRKYASVAEIILLAIHDLEDLVYAFHPSVGAASVSDLFVSWQLWRHVAKFSDEVGKSETAALIAGHAWAARSRAEEALDFFNKEFCTYTNEISPARSEVVRVQKLVPISSHEVKSTTKTRIDMFIRRVFDVEGERISRTAIWTVGGYRDATEFERFQRDDRRTTKAATESFNRVLAMEPSRFLELWRKLKGKSRA